MQEQVQLPGVCHHLFLRVAVVVVVVQETAQVQRARRRPGCRRCSAWCVLVTCCRG